MDGELISDAVTSPITLGILFGYVVGKPVGIVTAIWLTSRPWVTGLRPAVSFPVLLGGGAAAGIGFTVSLLIASIAFDGQQLEEAKLGVLAAAIASTLLSWLVFRAIRRIPTEMRARQLLGRRTSCSTSPTTSTPSATTSAAPTRAPVTLVEYGDYECPYCGQAEVVIRELLDEFGDELRYVWRHLPLNDVHTHAQLAAEAAEAAGAQGQFWGMHDKLLATQDELDGARPEALRGGARTRPRALRGRRCTATCTPTGSPRTWRAPTRAGSPARPASSSTAAATRARTTSTRSRGRCAPPASAPGSGRRRNSRQLDVVQASLAHEHARAVQHQPAAAQSREPRLLVRQPDERGVVRADADRRARGRPSPTGRPSSS